MLPLQGDVANFVETEQLLEVSGGGQQSIASSLVIVRGSIPLLWSQIPNIKYKPTTLLAPAGDNDAPFDRHIRELVEKYQAGLQPAWMVPALTVGPPEGCRRHSGLAAAGRPAAWVA